MHDSQSLLGQFFGRIKGSQEDIATEGVNYLLNRSAAARKGLASIIRNNIGIELPELAYRTQVIGENQERPDIVGVTAEGREVVIVESKFWSSLTDNQPNAYLNRFVEGTSVLLFICPSLRRRTLWQEVKMRLGNEYSINAASHYAGNAHKHILIKSWSEVLTTLREFLIQNNEYPLVSDVDQIIGLCNVIDKNTFLPISDEDLSPAVPRRISSYYDLVDKTLDEIRNRIPIDLAGLKATAQRSGYCRYFKYGDLGLGLQLNFDFWKKELDTPFWLNFHHSINGRWLLDDEVKRRVQDSGKRFYYNGGQVPHFGLVPPKNATEDVVINHLTEETIAIIRCMVRQLQHL